MSQAKTLSTLYSHCASHFHKRVEEKHTDLMQVELNIELNLS